MFAEIRTALRPMVSLLAFFTLLTGLAYPLLVTGLAQILMPANANGSLVEDRGRIIGSELIGQNFAAPRYFHGRPSAAGASGYDASASSGSNLGPGSQVLQERVGADVASLRAQGIVGSLPVDLVTTSASGLDPHISPEAALAQVPRVARERGLPEAQLRALIEQQQKAPFMGLIGERHVNLLALNMQLDRSGAKDRP